MHTLTCTHAFNDLYTCIYWPVHMHVTICLLTSIMLSRKSGLESDLVLVASYVQNTSKSFSKYSKATSCSTPFYKVSEYCQYIQITHCMCGPWKLHTHAHTHACAHTHTYTHTCTVHSGMFALTIFISMVILRWILPLRLPLCECRLYHSDFPPPRRSCSGMLTFPRKSFPPLRSFK